MPSSRATNQLAGIRAGLEAKRDRLMSEVLALQHQIAQIDRAIAALTEEEPA